MPNDEGVWIYHERQEAALCGQHALNNLVQAAIFDPYGLAEIAYQLDQIELNYMAQNNEGGIRYVLFSILFRFVVLFQRQLTICIIFYWYGQLQRLFNATQRRLWERRPFWEFLD
jgi:hypothetical protein